MEIYNRHINYPHNSKIAFIQSGNVLSVVNLEMYYVKFNDGINKRDGFYQDKGGSLFELFHHKVKNKTYKENRIVKEVQRSVRYYTFIKVVEHENPDIVGETMIFYFGNQIHNMILYSPKSISNVFFLRGELKQQRFTTFEESYFSSFEEIELEDSTLNIGDFVNIPVLDLDLMEKKIVRREKLEHIQKNTNLKQDILSILDENVDNETTTDKIIDIIAEI